MAATLTDLEPDALVHMADHLSHVEIASVRATCRAMRQAVDSNNTLWTSLFARQYPAPWRAVTSDGWRTQGQPWHQLYLATHTACQQLVSTRPAVRSWCTDSSAVSLAQIHTSGNGGRQRRVLTAQQNILEVKCGPPGGASFQLYGHNGRVSCASLLNMEPAGDRLGVVSGSADQTLRLWQARLPSSFSDTYGEGGESEEGGELHHPLSGVTLLTPTRTLRGHQESITCLQIVTGTTGVNIAATGGKDRVVKLWGLSPLLPSPVHQPQIATLRGHGAPVTCMAPLSAASGGCGTGGQGSAAVAALLTGGLDGRVKCWDVWAPGCISTAKCGTPVAHLCGICDPLGLAPAGLAQSAVLAAGGNAVHLLDVRSMRPAQLAAQPERAEQVLCLGQWGCDVVTGGRDAARVWDLRMAGGEPRLLLRDHTRQITRLHIDRHKVVTATDEYGEAPIRVWCRESGRLLNKLGSAPPPPPLPQRSSGNGAAQPSTRGGGEAAGNGEGEEAARGSEEEEEVERAGWQGVTALACRGAVLVSGNADGLICEMDYSHGGLPGREEGGAEGGEGERLLGKFWRVVDVR